MAARELESGKTPSSNTSRYFVEWMSESRACCNAGDPFGPAGGEAAFHLDVLGYDRAKASIYSASVCAATQTVSHPWRAASVCRGGCAQGTWSVCRQFGRQCRRSSRAGSSASS